METPSLESLVDMSGEVVLKYNPRYNDRLYYTKVKDGVEVDVFICDNNIRNCLNLLGRDDMLKLTNDQDLMRELRWFDDWFDDNEKVDKVLYYLISMNPISGMKYGALHAIRRLFYIAYKQYVEQYGFRTKRYTLLFDNDVIDSAIRGGDLAIYKSLVHYLNGYRITDVYEKGMFGAIAHDHTDIFKYLLERIHNVDDVLTKAVGLDKLQFIQPLIDECMKRYDVNQVTRILHNQIDEAVTHNSIQAFRALISHDSVDVSELQDVMRSIVLLERKNMLKYIPKDVNINNMLLTTAISSHNAKMVRSLLRLHDYDRAFLDNQFLTVVLADDMYIKHQKRMIDAFMKRLQTVNLSLYVNLIQIPKIREYLLTKYKSSILLN